MFVITLLSMSWSTNEKLSLLLTKYFCVLAINNDIYCRQTAPIYVLISFYICLSLILDYNMC